MCCVGCVVYYSFKSANGGLLSDGVSRVSWECVSQPPHPYPHVWQRLHTLTRLLQTTS